MFDRFGIVNKNKIIFGKNRNQSPNEPQVISFIKEYDKEKNLNKLLIPNKIICSLYYKNYWSKNTNLLFEGDLC